MGKTHIATFSNNKPQYELEYDINEYAEKHGCNPISISVFSAGIEYYAFVVMEERRAE